MSKQRERATDNPLNDDVQDFKFGSRKYYEDHPYPRMDAGVQHVKFATDDRGLARIALTKSNFSSEPSIFMVLKNAKGQTISVYINANEGKKILEFFDALNVDVPENDSAKQIISDIIKENAKKAFEFDIFIEYGKGESQKAFVTAFYKSGTAPEGKAVGTFDVEEEAGKSVKTKKKKPVEEVEEEDDDEEEEEDDDEDADEDDDSEDAEDDEDADDEEEGEDTDDEEDSDDEDEDEEDDEDEDEEEESPRRTVSKKKKKLAKKKKGKPTETSGKHKGPILKPSQKAKQKEKRQGRKW